MPRRKKTATKEEEIEIKEVKPPYEVKIGSDTVILEVDFDESRVPDGCAKSFFWSGQRKYVVLRK